MKYLWNKRIPRRGGGGQGKTGKREIAVPTWMRSFSRINVNHNFLDDDSRWRTLALLYALAGEHPARDGCSSTTNGRALVFRPSFVVLVVVVRSCLPGTIVIIREKLQLGVNFTSV